MLPDSVAPVLRDHLAAVREQHERDLAAGMGRVVLPFAYDRKSPHAAKEWGWQFVFPAGRRYRDSATNELVRHHLHESVVQRAFKAGVRAASGTPLPPTSFRAAMTSAPCRSCWATVTWRRR